MRKKTIRLLVAVLTLSASFAIAPTGAAAQSDPLRKDAYTGSQNADHMELRVDNVIVCKAYQTGNNTTVTATGCPTSGTARELLWNTRSDGTWYQVSKKTVTLGSSGSASAVQTGVSTAAGNGGSYTATQNAEHMELQQNNVIVCKAYNTSRSSKPTAAGCPTSGTAQELLWNSRSDGTWYQISERTVTLGSSGSASAVQTGASTAAGNGGASAVQTGASTAAGNGGRYTATQPAAHMELRQNNVIVCKVYYTSRLTLPTATGCPTSGTFRELLWNTNSDGSWYQVSKKTVTIG